MASCRQTLPDVARHCNLITHKAQKDCKTKRRRNGIHIWERQTGRPVAPHAACHMPHGYTLGTAIALVMCTRAGGRMCNISKVRTGKLVSFFREYLAVADAKCALHFTRATSGQVEAHTRVGSALLSLSLSLSFWPTHSMPVCWWSLA